MIGRIVASFRAFIDQPLITLRGEVEAQDIIAAQWRELVDLQRDTSKRCRRKQLISIDQRRESETLINEVTETLRSVQTMSNTVEKVWDKTQCRQGINAGILEY